MSPCLYWSQYWTGGQMKARLFWLVPSSHTTDLPQKKIRRKMCRFIFQSRTQISPRNIRQRELLIPPAGARRKVSNEFPSAAAARRTIANELPNFSPVHHGGCCAVLSRLIQLPSTIAEDSRGHCNHLTWLFEIFFSTSFVISPNLKKPVIRGAVIIMF